MRRRLSDEEFDAYTDAFASDALRCEALAGYDVASDQDAFARWQAGEPVDPAVTGPWGRWVQDQRAQGATVQRLRVITGPLTDYLRFELGPIYAANAAAGEEIRVLDVSGLSGHPATELPELWMLDRSRLAVMAYDLDDAFLHADAVEGADAAGLCAAVEDAWRVAVPYEQYRSVSA